MHSENVTFRNQRGQFLTGRVDFPLTGKPLAYALYAHCFTCNKNLRAIGRITQTLAQHGIATLRFDFTGLGESEGDFSETNFSSSVADFELAARYLGDNFEAPEVLIGHSLGGAVALAAASAIDSARAVVTVAAPATPQHIERHIAADLATIEADGVARRERGRSSIHPPQATARRHRERRPRPGHRRRSAVRSWSSTRRSTTSSGSRTRPRSSPTLATPRASSPSTTPIT